MCKSNIFFCNSLFLCTVLFYWLAFLFYNYLHFNFDYLLPSLFVIIMVYYFNCFRENFVGEKKFIKPLFQFNKFNTKVIKQSNSHWLNYFVPHNWNFRCLQITQIWSTVGVQHNCACLYYWRIYAHSVFCDAFGWVIYLRSRLKLNCNAFS